MIGRSRALSLSHLQNRTPPRLHTAPDAPVRPAMRELRGIRIIRVVAIGIHVPVRV